MKIYRIIAFAFLALSFFGCGNSDPVVVTPQVVSPTDTLKNFIEASKKKDVEAIKKSLSKGSLALAEKSAQSQGIAIDELFRRDNAQMPSEVPEIRNEKVEGDTATVEVKDLTSGYDTIPFVKEDGAWKIAFDKYQETMLEKMRQEMNVLDASDVNANQPDNTAASKNKTKADK